MKHDSLIGQQARALSLSDELHKALGVFSGTRCCLAYDQTAGMPKDDNLTAALEQGSHSWIEVPVRHSQMDRSMWPLWLPVDSLTSAGSHLIQSSVVAALAELQPEALCSGSGRKMGGWLILRDGCSIQQAAAHFGACMLQRTQGGTMLLRLQDPAVLWSLWALLDSRQQATLLGPIRQYWLLNPEGRLCKLDGSTAVDTSLTLTATQWRDVMLIRPANQALRGWLAARNAVHSEPGSIEACRDAAMAALRRGVAHGLSDVDDLAAFASHALSIHSRFDEHPAVRELLQRRASNGEYYTNAVEVFTEADWHRISSDQRHADRGERQLNHDREERA